MNNRWGIYKAHLIEGLQELADRQYQNDIWLNQNNPSHSVGSFIEAALAVFDDSLVMNALRAGAIIYDQKVTQALWELSIALNAIDESRDEEAIISDPLMQVVREKAARVLFLINVSIGEGNTVDLFELGMPAPPLP
ncbi:MAG: hypothetical protein SFW64_03720 [Alphaproteobacteria bacterium]|nr:hypothetical protein [Alphaproteobacteria bacterium]